MVSWISKWDRKNAWNNTAWKNVSTFVRAHRGPGQAAKTMPQKWVVWKVECNWMNALFNGQLVNWSKNLAIELTKMLPHPASVLEECKETTMNKVFAFSRDLKRAMETKSTFNMFQHVSTTWIQSNCFNRWRASQLVRVSIVRRRRRLMTLSSILGTGKTKVSISKSFSDQYTTLVFLFPKKETGHRSLEHLCHLQFHLI